MKITASWIDEAGEGETECFTELWDRIIGEIAAADYLVLYAEQDDFPLKGALIEVGIALGLGKPVTVCLPGVQLCGRTHRPIGSWIEHRHVTRLDDISAVLGVRPASVDTLPKGGNGAAGSVRSKGSAVGSEADETPNLYRSTRRNRR